MFLAALLLLSVTALAAAHQDEMSPARLARLRVLRTDPSGKRATEAVDVSAVVLAPWTTEGPYASTIADYAEDTNMTAAAVELNRREVLDGVPLALTLNVYDVVNETATEMAGAKAYLWHCDADGVYSATALAGASTNKIDTVGMKWLRSVAETDSNGKVTFNTIIPGWYGGRTLHFHLRIHAPTAESETTYAITTQLMFQDAVQEALTEIAPYSSSTTQYTKLATDMIYTAASASVGDGLLLDLVGSYDTGFTAEFDLGIDQTITGGGAGVGGGPMMGGMGQMPPPDGGPMGGSTSATTAAATESATDAAPETDAADAAPVTDNTDAAAALFLSPAAAALAALAARR